MRRFGVFGAIVLFLVSAHPTAAATATSSHAYGDTPNEKGCIRTHLGVDVRQLVSKGEIVSSELFADLSRLNTCTDRRLFYYKVLRPLQSDDHFRVSPDRSRGRLVADVAWRDPSTGEVIPGTINVTWTANDSNPVCGDPADLQRQADMTGTATLGHRTFRFTLPDEPGCSYLYRSTFEFDE